MSELRRAGWIGLWAPITLLFTWALPAAARHGSAPAPDELGPWAVGRTTFVATDLSRGGRELVVDVWYPVNPADAAGPPTSYVIIPPLLVFDSTLAVDNPPVAPRGSFPLVVFSHGNGGLRFQSFFLTEALASYGFVVAAPDHTGNTAFDVLFGSPSERDFVQAAFDRPTDISFIITTMLARSRNASDPFFRALHPFRVGVTGHSFGGFTALAMASGFDGEALDDNGGLSSEFEPVFRDRRVRAIVPIAPASSLLSDAELERIRVPTLFIGGTADVTTPLVPQVTRPFERIAARPRFRVDLDRVGHFSFTNVCDLFDTLEKAGVSSEVAMDLVPGFDEGCAPELLPVAEAHRLTNLYAVAFFRRFLSHDTRYEPFLTRAFAEGHEPDVGFFSSRRSRPRFDQFLLLLQGRF